MPATTTTHTVLVAQPAPWGTRCGVAAHRPARGDRQDQPYTSRATLFKAQVVAAKRLVERGNNPAAVVILKVARGLSSTLPRAPAPGVTAADVAPLRSLLVQTIG